MGVIMPCHSQPVDEEYALELAAAFGIKTYKAALTGAYARLVEGGEGAPAGEAPPEPPPAAGPDPASRLWVPPGTR